MAKYSDIKGFTVQTLSTDTTESGAAGGAWASGGDMPAAKYIGFPAGTQTAGLYANGQGASGNTDRTEEYDGSSWSSGGDLQEAMSTGHGFGTQTAGVRFGGEN